jgi:hypothetical protein
VRVASADDGKVTAVKVWTAQPDYEGPCPVRIVIEGQVTTSGPVAGLTVQFQHSDGTRSKVIAVVAKAAGAHAVQEVIDRRSGAWNHTITLQVLTPSPMASEALTIRGRCTAAVVAPPPGKGAAGGGGVPGFPPDGLPPLAGGMQDPGPTPGGVPKSEATFRLRALGFRVVRQSIESVAETNGVGDEVMLISRACEYQVGRTRPLAAVTSLVHGSLDFGALGELPHGRPRVRAGSGNGVSRGGLVAGDEVRAGLAVPTTGDVAYNRAHMFPLVLWEGALREGPEANLVVVAPSLWELDGNHVEPAPSLDGQIARELAGSGDRFLREMGLAHFAATSSGDIEVVGSILPGEFDRPIGLMWRGPHSPIQAEQATVVFSPATVRLTRRTAQELADASGGRFDLTFTDDREFGGSYVLRLQVSRVL